MKFLRYLILFVVCQLLVLPCFAKRHNSIFQQGIFYLSWGYNTEWYTRSSVHISQPGLNSDYKLVKVKANDHRGWDENFQTQPITIPQYNYRIGFFFNKKHDLALEINFDHTKYLISNNQYLSVRGIYQGRYIDSTVLFSEDNGFYYFLNNGANFFLLNIVKKYTLVDKYRHNLRVDFLPKVGIGPVVPHVENKLFGKTNDAAFQIGGWNMGVETAIRATFFKYGFLEFAQKLDYARYSNLRVYSGRAKQSFATYELILTAGITLPTGKNNSLFQL